MGSIGNLGTLIVFEVSSDRVLTFDNLTQTVKGRWASHSVIGSKPLSEFLGADARTMQMPVYLSAAHGVNPTSIMAAIEAAIESGTPNILVIGGRRIGDNQWKITQMSEAWGAVLNNGRLASVNLTLTLEEYV